MRLEQSLHALQGYGRDQTGATMELFRDRRDAGRELARQLAGYARRSDVVILALPRGGVPVGYEIAQALQARRLMSSS